MLFHFKNIYLSAACLALFIGPLSACSVCGCGDPLATTENSQPLAGSLRLSIESVYLTASAQTDDLTSIEAVRQVNLNTTLSYNPSDDWSLTAMLPVVEKYWNVTPPDGANEGTPFGIGDVMVGVRYFFMRDTDYTTKFTGLAVSAGTYLPTGGTNFTSLVTGDNLDTHAQLGTGAWAFYGGLLYHRGWQDFSLVANVNYILRTRPGAADPSSPVYQYEFGDSFTGGVQAQWNIAEKLAVSLTAEGRYAWSDTYQNIDIGPGIVNVPNTGGTVLDATPGIWWNLAGDSTLYARVQIPFFTSLNGIQAVDPTYIFGTQFLIR